MKQCTYTDAQFIRAYATWLTLDKNPEAFIKWWEDAFGDTSLSVRDTIMNSGNSRRKEEIPPRIDPENKQGSIQTIDNWTIDSYYTGTDNQSRMQSKFTKGILKAAILDIKPDGITWVSQEALEDGISSVQNGICKFKESLVSELYIATGDRSSRYLDPTEDNYLNVIKDAINQYKNHFGKDLNTESAGYDAYVILNTFDDLIEKYAPYISIDPNFKKNLTGRYENAHKYALANQVSHYSSFSSGEQADISTQISALADAILEAIPEINRQNQVISGSSVTKNGFNSSMTTLKNALQYTNLFGPNQDLFFKAFCEGAGKLKSLKDNDRSYIQTIISAICNRKSKANQSVVGYSEYNSELLFNKLRAINTYLFSQTTPDYIKDMFLQMFYKTERTGYRAYTDEDGNFGATELVGKIQYNQLNLVSDLLTDGIRRMITSVDFANEFNTKYEVKLTDNVITIIDNKSKEQIELNLIYQKGSNNNKISEARFSEINVDFVNRLLFDMFAYKVPEQYGDCYPGGENGKWVNTFSTFIAFSAIASQHNAQSTYVRAKLSNILYEKNVNLSDYNAALLQIAARVGDCLGNSNKSVVKSLSGNNLPVSQLTSLQYQWKNLLYSCKQDKSHYVNGSFLDTFSHIVQAPQIRNELSINGVTKSSSKLTRNELLITSIFEDFYHPLKKGEPIYLQNATFSDKARQFLVGYNLNSLTIKSLIGNIGDRNLRSLLQPYKDKSFSQLLSSVQPGSTEEMLVREIIRYYRKLKYNKVQQNIINAYNKVYGQSWTTLNEVYTWLKDNKKTLKWVRADFDGKADFEEETFGIQPKGATTIIPNETLMKFIDDVSTSEKWKTRCDTRIISWANKISNIRLSRLDPVTKNLVNELSPVNSNDFFYDKRREELYLSKVTENGADIHPIALQYFYADMFLSNEFNSLTLGEIYAHPNKSKTSPLNPDGTENPNYLVNAEASRLANQIKRTVILGSTTHLFAQGLKYGVAPKIHIAILEDIKGLFHTINGDDDDIDSQDGSGFCTMLQSILENNSLVDAAVGDNKKTIVHNLSKTGTPTLLKWAVYALSNMTRRNSFGSNTQVENIVKKMYNKYTIPSILSTNIDLNNVYKLFRAKFNHKITVKTPYTEGKTIESFERVNENTWVTVYEDESKSDLITINTLYDIDQAFGGAWSYQKVNGKLVETEDSQQALAIAVCEYNLKDYQVAYAVNASACKVGATNINSRDKWSRNDNTELNTYDISTAFGGVMMDADHELDLAEVTEMTQMISSIIEDGRNVDLALAVYNDIGEIAFKNCEKLRTAIDNLNADPEQIKVIRRIVGQSLMNAFNSRSRDTIGLAQAFIRKANSEFQNGNIDFQIPFSDSTIYGIFISDVASTLNKQSIKRKYEGFAGVLNPSHDMMMFYKFGKNTMLYPEFAEYCYKTYGTTVEDLWNNEEVGKNSGLWKEVTNTSEIGFEDTLEIIDENGNKQSVYIQSYEDYDYYKHTFDYTGYKVYINYAKPRNLQGPDTRAAFQKQVFQNGKWVNVENPKWLSVNDLDSFRILQYINNDFKSNFKTKNNILLAATTLANNGYTDLLPFIKEKNLQGIVSYILTNKPRILKSLEILTQQDLDRLELGPNLGKDKYTNYEDAYFTNISSLGIEENVRYYASKCVTTPAEIITGRYQFDKLGIRPSDDINTITSAEYFKEIIKEEHNDLDAFNKSYCQDYDNVLYHNGEVFLIQIGKQSQPGIDANESNSIKLIEDNLCYNGERIISNTEHNNGLAGRIVAKTYTFNNRETYNILLVDSVDDYNVLQNSDFFDDISRNNVHDGNIKTSWETLIEDDELRYIDNGKSKTINEEQFNALTKSEQVTILRLAEDYRFTREVNNAAWNRYEAFKEVLKLIGTRIPTQSMQSYMPFKIVATVNSNKNVCYVCKAKTAIDGSDYWV